MQHALFPTFAESRPRGQLIKWIGNKQRFAERIASYFPSSFGRYYEPFLGSGAVLATLGPKYAVGSDIFAPLVEIWRTLRCDPELLKGWYQQRYEFFVSGEKISRYEQIKADYNAHPNGADLVFLCRACYGGVVRFRKADGYMSTPCGIHSPIRPESFAARVEEWRLRVAGTDFECRDYRTAFKEATRGDLVYCDPPYSHSQAILYGAQSFRLSELFTSISAAKERGVFVALSLDGVKKSGGDHCAIHYPEGLFAREVFLDGGRSMLRRFQMVGQTLESEEVSDRLLLTY